MLARTLKVSLVAVGLSLAAPAFSETLAVDGQVSVRPAGVETPQRGSTMSAVEAKFGAPTSKSSPVGKPPITKWFYPNFVVVFENDKVLHAVVTAAAPPPASEQAPAAAPAG
jgi:hypothetical protein